MTAPANRTALIASLANWLRRSDLSTTEIPEAIALAEQRFNRELRLPEMEEVVAATTAAATITLPGDFLMLRSAFLDTDPKVPLEQMTPADLRSFYTAAATGRPSHFALQSGDEIAFGPAPDGAHPIVINYYAKIPALTSGQPTNWLLTDHADLYIHAALVELYALLRDAERAAIHEARTRQIVDELHRQARRRPGSLSRRYVGSPRVGSRASSQAVQVGEP